MSCYGTHMTNWLFISALWHRWKAGLVTIWTDTVTDKLASNFQGAQSPQGVLTSYSCFGSCPPSLPYVEWFKMGCSGLQAESQECETSKRKCESFPVIDTCSVCHEKEKIMKFVWERDKLGLHEVRANKVMKYLHLDLCDSGAWCLYIKIWYYFAVFLLVLQFAC